MEHFKSRTTYRALLSCSLARRTPPSLISVPLVTAYTSNICCLIAVCVGGFPLVVPSPIRGLPRSLSLLCPAVPLPLPAVAVTVAVCAALDVFLGLPSDNYILHDPSHSREAHSTSELHSHNIT
jgi:hypothetical protein